MFVSISFVNFGLIIQTLMNVVRITEAVKTFVTTLWAALSVFVQTDICWMRMDATALVRSNS